MYDKSTHEQVKSFRGLQKNVEVVASSGLCEDFVGVLYADAEDLVVRKSKRIPSSECVLMSVWNLSEEECEMALKCETLEQLEIFDCELKQIPNGLAKLKKLKKLSLCGLHNLKSVPEEIGEVSSLKDLWMDDCGIENLPRGLKELKSLRSICLVGLDHIGLVPEDVAVFSKLKQLKIKWCDKAFTPSLAQSFWGMIKSNVYLSSLHFEWTFQRDSELVAMALEQNGSIIDGGFDSEQFAHFFKRNKENHERAMACVVQLIAIRRWRDALNGFPKEIIKMLAMILWNKV